MKPKLSGCFKKPINPRLLMKNILDAQRRYFRSGVTRSLSARRQALQRLRRALLDWEPKLADALQADLGKCASESYMCEIGMCLSSIRDTLAHLKRWAAPKRVPTPLSQFPACSRIVPEPYGVVLIISPWNYPILLCLDPLIAALSAGNCCVLKPSRQSAHVTQTLADMLGSIFPREYVAVVQGDSKVTDELLAQDFDYIFFTGSPRIGRKVMAAAAQHLTPVTLELGGKSPCIVDDSISLPLAARRIAFGKITNAGQTCVAPDYLLIHRSVREAFIAEYARAVREMLGEKPLQNPDYAHIINRHHFDRLCGLIGGSRVVFGGGADAASLRIEPTLLDDITPESPCMQEEIFGPILPIITWESPDEVEQFVLARPKPLACYIFTGNRATEKRLSSALSAGGICVNDTIVHLAVHALPFGGVGQSGMGAYHGRAGFDTFSHAKPILHRSAWLDLPFRYAPFSPLKNRILRFFLK